MRARLYWTYVIRSLRRGGSRTVLAIFCVAVGVLAIVAVQLVSNGVSGALLGNVRSINGGDLHVASGAAPLSASGLAFFHQLQAQGTLTSYTAADRQPVKLTVDGQTSAQRFGVEAVDPNRFPLAGAPVFTSPTNSTFESLLWGNSAVITSTVAQILNLHVGDRLRLTARDGRTGEFTIRGVIESSGPFQGPVLVVNISAYAELSNSSGQPITYTDVYLDVPGHGSAQANRVEQQIKQHFPLADVQTPAQLLATQQQQVNQIRYFLQIVGLVALLIGGIGIGNTMQVVLRRRRTEIAMLKTVGYRRRDLYALFGLETFLIGLAGGALGAVTGLGISVAGATLVEAIFQITLPSTVDLRTLGAGVAIGAATALIFGVQPIIQASQIRPLAVLRELPEGTAWRSRFLTVGLTALLGVLFFGMAQVIVQSLVVAGLFVVGTALVLALLGGVLWLLVWRISAMAPPKRFHWWYLPLVAAALLIAYAAAQLSPALGVLVFAVTALGGAAVLLPHSWKSHVTLALRNFGRQKTRAVGTLVALSIGALAIGLVLILAADIGADWTQGLAANSHVDAAILAHGTDRHAIDKQLAHMPDATNIQVTNFASVVPTAINGQSTPQFVRGATTTGQYTTSQVLQFVRSVQGYDLARGQVPDPTLVTIVRGSYDLRPGRTLSPADAGTGNALLPAAASGPPDNLRLGDSLTLAPSPGASGAGAPITLRVVGFYTSNLQFGNILLDAPIVSKVSGGNPMFVYLLHLSPQSADVQLAQIQSAAPAAWTFSTADVVAQVNDLLNNLMTLLVVIASLTMLAAIIGIANAVALGLLERRRELGILKAVGFTSGDVVGEVLIENALVGLTAGGVAVLCVCALIPLIGTVLLRQPFDVPAPLAAAILLGAAGISMVVAAAVSWHPTRVRPLEVLRYE